MSIVAMRIRTILFILEGNLNLCTIAHMYVLILVTCLWHAGSWMGPGPL